MTCKGRNCCILGDFQDFPHGRCCQKYFYYSVFVISCTVILVIVSEISMRFSANRIEVPITTSRPILRAYLNPVDPLDGVGYQFGKDAIFEPDPVKTLDNLPVCDLSHDKNPMQNEPNKILEEFHKCIKPAVEKFKNKPSLMNKEYFVRSYDCDLIPILKNLPMEKYRNLHELRWTILPKCKDNNTVLTLGIGHDTIAEESLHRTMPNTKFYGADPMISPNLQLFSSFGTFFPFAVGKASGVGRFRVLPNQNQKTRIYSYQNVTTIEFSYFLRVILKLQRIDIAWINIEGGELEFLDYFYKGGILDQNKVTICQFNLDIHSTFHPTGEQLFHDFIFRIIEESRYVFFKPVRPEVGVHRMFFLNIEDKECVRKFIQ